MSPPDRSTATNEITARLSGDAAADFEYLRDLIRRIGDTEAELPFKRAAARLLMELAPRRKVNRWRRLFRKISQRVEKDLNAAKSAFAQERYDDVCDILQPLAARLDGFFAPDASAEYLYFCNPLEEAICAKLRPSTKERRRPPVDYPAMQFLLGSALLEKKRTKEAKIAVKKGLAFNPINVELLLKATDVARREGMQREYLDATLEALRCAYRLQDLARAYRNLGFFQLKKGRRDLAANLYHFSLTIEESEDARRQLRQIDANARRPAKPPTAEKIREIFQSEGIQFGPNPEVLEVVENLAESAAANDDWELADDCREIAEKLKNVRR
ncbi:MAG: hypothetical protein HUK22_05590 [Thermoguttaceae bacterium]|nr:hypothetical protein [Thermoguttaceae bacterium]